MNLKKHHLTFFLIISVLLIFIPNLPHAVQTLDTAELVRSAFALQVSHPPGYPFLILLLKSIISVIPFGTVFWRAAFFNSIIAVFTCVLCFCYIRQLRVIAVSAVLVMASSRIFWKYSELPDVFMLNTLFAVLICTIYLDNSKIRFQKLIPLIFLIGLTHHLTLIFLAPVVLHVFISNIKSKSIWFLSILGLVFFVIMYTLLLVFNTEALYSWGDLQTIKDVCMHFLRKDYGTFQLVQGESAGSFLAIFKRFFNEGIKDFFIVIVLGLLAFFIRVFRKQKIQLREIIFTSCIVAYILIFFNMSNLQPVGILTEVIDRFYLLAYVLIFIWSAHQILKVKFNKKIYMAITVFLLTNVLFNYYRHRQENNFSTNTIVEDYAINLLNQMSNYSNLNKPTLLMAVSDTRRFALEYVQVVLNVKSEIIILHPSAIVRPWYQNKIKKAGVSINYNPDARNTIIIEDDLIFPNIDKFNILTHLNFESYRRYKLTIMPLGRILEKGTGLDFYDKNSNLFLRSTFQDIKTDINEYDIYREIWTEYGGLHYSQGLGYLTAGNESLAKREFEETIKIVPWHFPALEILCKLEKDNEKFFLCNDRLKQAKSEYYNYF